MNTNKILLPPALIKLGEKKYMNQFFDGNMRISPISKFKKMEEGKDKIADKYEGELYHPVENLYIAPILSDTKEKIKYGKPIKISNETELKFSYQNLLNSAMFSLYSYWYQPINSVVRLDNYDMVTKDMPNYDSAVIIYNPLKFIEKIEKITSIYCNHIQYTDETPNDFEIENKLQTLFYKRKQFEEQKEFRIILPEIKLDDSTSIQITSLEDCAYLVPLTVLKKGILIADSIENFNQLSNKHSNMKFGDLLHFSDFA